MKQLVYFFMVAVLMHRVRFFNVNLLNAYLYFKEKKGGKKCLSVTAFTPKKSFLQNETYIFMYLSTVNLYLYWIGISRY